jgi:serine/threonine protein kinase
VFEKPLDVDPLARPVSLLNLFHDTEVKVPSLTARVALAKAIAECIEKLHAVNWLHKGLRSDNVLFFRSGNADCDISRPYLSGFDYSRPAQREDMTERPSGNMAHDLYRHPQVQGPSRDTPNGKGYKKRHDIYSLGVILMEIAYWKSIDAIVGLKQSEIRPSETARLRGRLLNGEYLNQIHSQVGDTIYEVISSCLVGVSSFGIREGDDEMDVFVGAKLQAKFYTLVIEKLHGIKI